MKKHFFRLILLLMILGTGRAVAQSDTGGTAATGEVAGGFRQIKLGMDIDRVKELLLEDSYFAYRGDPDVSFLPITAEPLIECDGNSYIKKGYFQFHEEKLYIIILVLDQAKIDYFTMYQTLTRKYGEADALDPSQVVWEFNEIRLSLERPLSIKYIATEVFARLQAASSIEEDFLAISKQEFLEQF